MALWSISLRFILTLDSSTYENGCRNPQTHLVNCKYQGWCWTPLCQIFPASWRCWRTTCPSESAQNYLENGWSSNTHLSYRKRRFCKTNCSTRCSSHVFLFAGKHCFLIQPSTICFHISPVWKTFRFPNPSCTCSELRLFGNRWWFARHESKCWSLSTAWS